MHPAENFPNILKVTWQSEKGKRASSSPFLVTERQWTWKMDTCCFETPNPLDLVTGAKVGVTEEGLSA